MSFFKHCKAVVRILQRHWHYSAKPLQNYDMPFFMLVSNWILKQNMMYLSVYTIVCSLYILGIIVLKYRPIRSKYPQNLPIFVLKRADLPWFMPQKSCYIPQKCN